MTEAAALTANIPGPAAVVWSGLAIVTLPEPRAAPGPIAMFAVSCVALTKVVELTVIPAAENAAVAPLSKFVPVIVTLSLLAPRLPEFGLAEEIVGAPLTVTRPCPVPIAAPI